MLDIPVEKIFELIARARAFDAKVEVVEPDSGSNPADDDMRAVLEDHGDDATYEEIMELINSLSVDAQTHLVALTWLGRGTYGEDEWEAAVAEARRAHNERTAEYLLGIPLLGDYLEEGLSRLGYSRE